MALSVHECVFSTVALVTDALVLNSIHSIDGWLFFIVFIADQQIKENTKALCHWPLWGESTGDRWIPLTMDQWCKKCFHLMTSSWTLQWCHNGHDGISNHQPNDCLLVYSGQWKKLRVTGLCEGNPLVTSGFPSQRASNAEKCVEYSHGSVSQPCVMWLHHGLPM